MKDPQLNTLQHFYNLILCRGIPSLNFFGVVTSTYQHFRIIQTSSKVLRKPHTGVKNRFGWFMWIVPSNKFLELKQTLKQGKKIFKRIMLTTADREDKESKPGHWVQLSRTREKPNPHFHNINPTHYLLLLPCFTKIKIQSFFLN